MTRDRRKPHVREADEEAAALESGWGGMTENEGDITDAAAETSIAGLIFDKLLHDDEQFESLVCSLLPCVAPRSPASFGCDRFVPLDPTAGTKHQTRLIISINSCEEFTAV